MFDNYELKRIRLREKEKLDSKNKVLFQCITEYINCCDITKSDKEEILHEILDSLLQCEQKNKDVEIFIGQDYKKFCDAIVDEYSSSTTRLYIAVNFIEKYFIQLFIICTIMFLAQGFQGGQFSIDLKDFYLANIIVLFIRPLSTTFKKKNIEVPLLYRITMLPNSLSTEKKWYKTLFIFVIIFTAIALLAGREILNKPLYFSNLWPILLIFSIIICCIHFYKYYNKIKHHINI
ncbi:hypothetical protein [Desnuesiella massiliensis]|uniref:hypothetical protein n=1 Tax=Desnuesiella massiliensis TaxID=1650662 RepID=UPI0006E1A47E|nr:hypothetical protein [Desnuesiella massiliensis]